MRERPHKAIFFDRDGTLIVDKVYLNDPDGIEYLPQIFDALRELRDAGFQFFVVTNQSGVPRGKVTIANLNEIHQRVRAAFAVHGIEIREFYYAPYLTDHDHIYRKPNPGMLLQAAQEYNLDLGASWMIGDRMSDVEAGHRAGTRTILLSEKIKAGAENEAHAPGEAPEWAPPDGVFHSVAEAVPFILESSASEKKSK